MGYKFLLCTQLDYLSSFFCFSLHTGDHGTQTGCGPTLLTAEMLQGTLQWERGCCPARDGAAGQHRQQMQELVMVWERLCTLKSCPSLLSDPSADCTPGYGHGFRAGVMRDGQTGVAAWKKAD